MISRFKATLSTLLKKCFHFAFCNFIGRAIMEYLLITHLLPKDLLEALGEQMRDIHVIGIPITARVLYVFAIGTIAQYRAAQFLNKDYPPSSPMIKNTVAKVFFLYH